MNHYPFKLIHINGRLVSLDDIRFGKSKAQTDFESDTFLFIQDWLKGVALFTLTTSGSTGSPKKITITRDQIIASVNLTRHALGLKSGLHAMICLDTKYIAGKMMLARSLEIGMHIAAVSPSANPFEKKLIDFRIDFTAFAPLQLQTILESENEFQLNLMQAILVGGAPISSFLQNQIQKITAPVYLTYGMTETISHIALQRLNGSNAQDSFQTLPGIQIEQDLRGCLVISASHLTEKIITNDIVEILGANKFRWKGRWDNVINSGGVKISPEQLESKIESIVNQLNINSRFFIAEVPDEKIGNRVILIMEGPVLEENREKELRRTLQEQLAKFEQPRSIYFLNSFPITKTSKIDRKACLLRLYNHFEK